MRTKLQGGTVVGFNGHTHVLIRDGVVVWEDDRITFVGKTYDGPVDRTLQASERLIMPGLIDLHWHAGVRANWRLTSDHGDPQFFGAGFPNTEAGRRGASYPMSTEEAETAATLNVVELLSGGCTTLVEVGASVLLVEQLAAQVERFGVRAYLGPGYRSAGQYRDADGVIQYDWDEVQGSRAWRPPAVSSVRTMARRTVVCVACSIHYKWTPAHASCCRRRVRPPTPSTCLCRSTPGRTSWSFTRPCASTAARPWNSSMRPASSVQGPRLATASWSVATRRPTTRMGMISSALPQRTLMWPTARCRWRGAACTCITSPAIWPVASMSGWARTFIPLTSSVRCATPACSVKSLPSPPTLAPLARLFRRRRLVALLALGRPDLGRLCPGAKADLVIVNQRALHYGAVCDPIRSLVDCGVASDVETVIVDGQVSHGQPPHPCGPSPRCAVSARPAVCGSLLGHVSPVILGWTHRRRDLPERLPMGGRTSVMPNISVTSGLPALSV